MMRLIPMNPGLRMLLLLLSLLSVLASEELLPIFDLYPSVSLGECNPYRPEETKLVDDPTDSPARLSSRYAASFSVHKVQLGRLLQQFPVANGSVGRQGRIEHTTHETYVGDEQSEGQQENMLIAAARLAWSHHLPLVLTPDVFWVTILQGVSAHINANPEKYRSVIVAHDGKKELTVVEPGPSVNYTNAVKGFLDEISKNICNQNLNQAIKVRFSTTTLKEELAFGMSIMDSVKSYFDYKYSIACGIPEIALLGTKEDWQKLVNLTALLDDLDLQWWRQRLLPILNNCTAVFDGDIDVKFWDRIIQYHIFPYFGKTHYINGWLLNFFPYLRSGTINGKVYYNEERSLEIRDLPLGLTSTPFVVDNNGVKQVKLFVAGVFSVQQDKETLALTPDLGWAVVTQGLKGSEEGNSTQVEASGE